MPATFNHNLQPFFSLHAWNNETPINAGKQNQPKGHDIIELWWIIKGDGLFNIDLQSFSLKTNTLFCVLPGQAFQLMPDGDIEAYTIRFSPALLCLQNAGFIYHPQLLSLWAQCSARQFDGETGTEILDLIKKLQKEEAAHEDYKFEMLSQYLNLFLRLIQRKVKQDHNIVVDNNHHRLLKNFLALVEQHFKSNKRVADYARLLMVTPNYLNFTIKKATGTTAGHHIRNRIAMEAQRHAIYSDDSMKEIAWNLGFGDIAHFSKFFKKTTGNNFSSFKKTTTPGSLAGIFAA